VEDSASNRDSTTLQLFPSPSNCPKVCSGVIGRHHPPPVKPPPFPLEIARNQIDTWVQAHKGIHVTIDTTTLRVNVTRISNAIEVSALLSPALSTENQPYIKRISNLNLEDLIPQKKARELISQLNEDSSDLDIKETLELISDQDIQLFLFDVISLIRNGDINGAETRVKLRSGEAVPAEDCVDFAIESAKSEVNSDQILLINDFSLSVLFLKFLR
jgi:hypothetical protein